MSSDRLRTQIQFENILSGNDPSIWQALQETQIKNFEFTAVHNVILESALKDDAIDFYFKGLLSLYESLISINYKNFSWATVKGYYSVFYFLRCSLCSNNIAFVRKERECYQFQNKLAEKPKKVSKQHKSDHKAAIELFKLYNDRSDFLQSNKINGKSPYEWLMLQRENINYKYRTFYEPDVPAIWDVISDDCDADGIEFWMKKYLHEDVYPFLEDHAAMAIPLKRLVLTHNDLLSQNTRIIVRPEKEEKLLSMIGSSRYLGLLAPYNRGKA